jgi:nucleoside-diphosphate-sugar epimerase
MAEENIMHVFVTGASGATGRLLLQILLERGLTVTALVRNGIAGLPGLQQNEHLKIITASILDLNSNDLAKFTSGCDAVVSCLGHNLTFKGIFGEPRRLVTNATKSLCNVIKANQQNKPTKFILMNTAGNSNLDLKEDLSVAHRTLIFILRNLLPPHADNEDAANFLRLSIGQSHRSIEWSVVRPDTLINEENVSGYNLLESPCRSALFNPGKTSRINVAHFISELICSDEVWRSWRGKMPVIYNTN